MMSKHISSVIINIYKTKTHIELASAKQFLEAISSRINDRKNKDQRILVTIAGGSLPSSLSRGIFGYDTQDKNTLTSQEVDLLTDIQTLRNSIAWDKIVIAPLDERCVLLSSPDSNASLLIEYFEKPFRMDEIYKGPVIITLNEDILRKISDEPEQVTHHKDLCNQFENDIKAAMLTPSVKDIVDEQITIDVSAIGMGPDGHVASIFPSHPSFENDTVLTSSDSKATFYVTNSPKPPPMRITFTLAMIQKTHHIVGLTTGREKASAIRAIPATFLDVSIEEVLSISTPEISPDNDVVDASIDSNFTVISVPSVIVYQHEEENNSKTRSVFTKKTLLPLLRKTQNKENNICEELNYLSVPAGAIRSNKNVVIGSCVWNVDIHSGARIISLLKV